jgi:hypothetical protein
MLDYRAWIIAACLLLTAAGAYLLWLYRPKATYTASSLTATHSEAKNLHVEGCREDFIASPGELIEPLAVPGDSSISSARSTARNRRNLTITSTFGTRKRSPSASVTWAMTLLCKSRSKAATS